MEQLYRAFVDSTYLVQGLRGLGNNQEVLLGYRMYKVEKYLRLFDVAQKVAQTNAAVLKYRLNLDLIDAPGIMNCTNSKVHRK